MQVLDALVHMHGLEPPVAHGDIKAVRTDAQSTVRLTDRIRHLDQANILLNQQREAVLCDFGLSKASLFSGLTMSAGFEGSFKWCSPELHMDDLPDPDAGSDVWAWACLVSK